MKQIIILIFVFLNLGSANASEQDDQLLRFKVGVTALVGDSDDLAGYMGGVYSLEYSKFIYNYSKMLLDLSLTYSHSPMHIRDENETEPNNLQLNSYSVGLGINYNFWKRSVLRFKLGGGVSIFNSTAISHFDLSLSKAILTKNGHEFSINLEYKKLTASYEGYEYAASPSLSYGFGF